MSADVDLERNIRDLMTIFWTGIKTVVNGKNRDSDYADKSSKFGSLSEKCQKNEIVN